MRNEVVMIDADNPDQTVVERAADLLQRGKVVVAPTETRYGLLARADAADSVIQLCRLKERPECMPISIFIRGYEEASEFGTVNAVADRLAEAFLPGPLTLVLKAACALGQPIVVEDKIGVRVSSARLIESLMKKVDFPVTATSANISGDRTAASASDIASIFDAGVELFLDAGPLSGPASTVVDCSEGTARVLREGGITREMIRNAVERQP